MFDRRTRHSHEMFNQLKKHFGRQMCDPIHYSVRLSEAPTLGRTIFEYKARAQGAYDYQSLVRRIINNGR
jgi:chromosome partitioning protein